MYDICCVGHITSDKVINTERVMYMPGGTAWYFSCALSKLDVRYILVTALAETEMHYVTDLRDKGIEVKVQPSAHTVCFENIYAENQDERTQNVLQKADSFTIEGLLNVDAKIIHLGPLLADDFSIDLIKALAGKTRLSLDVQGYLRKVVNKKVHLTSWPDKIKALQYINILKTDVNELLTLTGYKTIEEGVKFLAGCGVKEAVITDGSAGSVIYAGDNLYHIPAYHPEKVTDATGCGDTYIAGYLYQRNKGTGIQQAGGFAAAMAALKTMTAGAFIGMEEDIIEFLKLPKFLSLNQRQ